MISTIIDIAKDRVIYHQIRSICCIFCGDLTILVQGHFVSEDFFQLLLLDVGVLCNEKYQCKSNSRLV